MGHPMGNPMGHGGLVVPKCPLCVTQVTPNPIDLGAHITTSTPSIHPSNMEIPICGVVAPYGVGHVMGRGHPMGHPMGHGGLVVPKCPLCGTQVAPNPIVFGYNHHNFNAIHP